MVFLVGMGLADESSLELPAKDRENGRSGAIPPQELQRVKAHFITYYLEGCTYEEIKEMMLVNHHFDARWVVAS